MTDTIKQILYQLDVDKLLTDSNEKMKEIRKSLKEEMSKTKKQLQQASDTILFCENKDYDENWEEADQYKKMQELQNIYRSVEKELSEKQKLLIDNRQLYQLTIEAIENRGRNEYQRFNKSAY